MGDKYKLLDLAPIALLLGLYMRSWQMHDSTVGIVCAVGLGAALLVYILVKVADVQGPRYATGGRRRGRR